MFTGSHFMPLSPSLTLSLCFGWTHEQARLELYLMLKSVDDRDISRGMHSTITAIHLRRGNAFICACMCSTSKHKSSHSWKSTAGVCVCVHAHSSHQLSSNSAAFHWPSFLSLCESIASDRAQSKSEQRKLNQRRMERQPGRRKVVQKC